MTVDEVGLDAQAVNNRVNKAVVLKVKILFIFFPSVIMKFYHIVFMIVRQGVV
jgi:hypothetical protein